MAVDREEITVVLTVADVEASDARASPTAEAGAGRARAFREDTREAGSRSPARPSTGTTARSRGACGSGEHEELFTHLAVPVMTRLRQPERQVLDTLVESGVARSRADALAWCVRLVGAARGGLAGRAARGDDRRRRRTQQGPGRLTTHPVGGRW